MKRLDGIKVIEIGTVVLGPYVGQILADLGAEVIKVEALWGDVTRDLGTGKTAGMSALFLGCNRGKKSIALDLKKAEGRAVLDRLVEGADILVHNMRADTAAQLGLYYERLAAINSRLIFCGTYGFGASGRYAKMPAYDDIIQAFGGIAALNQKVGGPPRYAPTILADKGTALFSVIGILSALFERSRTGKGCEMEVPMFETMAHFLSIEHLGARTYDPSEEEYGYARLLNVHRKPYETKDGFLAVMPYSEQNWLMFFEAVERGDILEDPRFATAQKRAENISALYEEMASAMRMRTTAEWLDYLNARDIPCAPIQSLDDMLGDPHLAEVGFWHRYEHPSEGTLVAPSFPVRFDGPEGSPAAAVGVPRLGEHTRDILTATGYSAAEIDALGEGGVITCGDA